MEGIDVSYRGLTWDHPRGYDALAETARRVNAQRSEPLVHWDKQPLEGFESAPITELAAKYDLVVLDHPHIGEAVIEDCLIPLEDLFESKKISTWEGACVGPSFRSYQWQGKHWALPLDVATQVVARRPNMIAEAPKNWDEIEEIAAKRPTALSLGGPHAFLNLISLAAADGDVIGGDQMLNDEVALAALSRLLWLARTAPKGTEKLNPIALLETMAQGDEIALVPLVFGYVNYARPGPNAVAFSDTPRAQNGRGGVLGGTGLAFSRRSTPDAALCNYVENLLSVETQSGLFPDFGGQPSARKAWQSQSVNDAWGHFYRDTLATAENALLRPRFDGFPAFANAASSRLRQALEDGEEETRTLSALRDLWRDARRHARGDLDDNRE